MNEQRQVVPAQVMTLTLSADHRVIDGHVGAQFLTTLEAASASLDLYNVAMPELVYPNCNIEMYGFRRTAENGATLIVVDIGLQEIRQTATQTFSNTATPVAADQVNTGPVQTTTPTTSQQSALQSLM